MTNSSAPRPALFADLDATTIYSGRRILAGGSDFTGKVCVETYKDAPLSFMTWDAINTLIDLSVESLTFVPATTRTRAQYERVRIPGVNPKYAIVANGGQILVDGQPDAEWGRRIDKLMETITPVDDVLNEIAFDLKDTTFFELMRKTDDLFIFLAARKVEDIPDWFREYAEEKGKLHNYLVSVQGRKVYFIPNGLNKELAAKEVASRIDATKTFGTGDSVLDLGLMQLADHAIQPRHGELSALGIGNIVNTKHSGILAGEDILAFVKERL